MSEREKAAVYFIDLMSKYGQKSPYYNTAQMKMGLITYNRGEVSKALAYYKNVINSDPSPKEKNEALNAIEEIYIEDLANSTAYLRYLDSIPDGGLIGLSKDSLTYHLAYALFSNSQYIPAENAFSEYLKSFPLGYYKNDAKYYRAESNNVLKAYNKSLQDYEAIILDGPGKYYQKSVYNAALIAYNYTQDFNKSLKYYKEYENLASDIAEVFQSQFGALKSAFKLLNDSEVIHYGEKVVANNAATRDEKSSAYYYIGKSYAKKGNINKAIESFDKVDKLSNNNQGAESRFLLAEFAFVQNKIADAEKLVNYANEKNTNYPYWIAKGLMLLSDIYVTKSDLLNARAALEAVIENFKDDANILTQAYSKLDQLKIKETNANRIKKSNDKVDILDKKKN
jgi:TolA-binding protein